MPALPDNQPIPSSVSDKFAPTRATTVRTDTEQPTLPSEKSQASEQRLRHALRVLDQDVEWVSDLLCDAQSAD
jgi:hypothetical protein